MARGIGKYIAGEYGGNLYFSLFFSPVALVIKLCSNREVPEYHRRKPLTAYRDRKRVPGTRTVREGTPVIYFPLTISLQAMTPVYKTTADRTPCFRLGKQSKGPSLSVKYGKITGKRDLEKMPKSVINQVLGLPTRCTYVQHTQRSTRERLSEQNKSLPCPTSL